MPRAKGRNDRWSPKQAKRDTKISFRVHHTTPGTLDEVAERRVVGKLVTAPGIGVVQCHHGIAWVKCTLCSKLTPKNRV